jgi:chromosome partitioning protein
VLSGRKNKGAQAYQALAANLLDHWNNGTALKTFAAYGD